MNTKAVGISVFAVICGMMATSAVRASSISAQLTSSVVGPGLPTGLKVTFVGGSPSTTVQTGQINWKVTSSNTPGYSTGGTFSTYCIQGDQSVTYGQTYTYTVVNLESSGVPEGGLDAGVLDATAALQIQGLANTYFSKAGTAIAGYDANQTAAAFQLAVWEIEYDGGSGGESFPQTTGYNFFAHGLLEASGTNSEGTGAITLADSWLQNFTAATSVTSLALVSTGAQDQLIFNPSGGSGGNQSAVPLPAAFPAGAALLAGLAGVRKLRRKAV